MSNVYAKDNLGQTELMRACTKGDLETVKSLIEAGSDVNAQDLYGKTPLIHAIQGYREHTENVTCEIVKVLIDFGANVNSVRDNGMTALHTACLYNLKEVAELLIKAGASLIIRNSSGNTPLLLASFFGNIEIVKLFIDLGLDDYIKIKDLGGDTPLTFAKKFKYVEIEELLIAAGFKE